jgi:hypothetical protein
MRSSQIKIAPRTGCTRRQASARDAVSRSDLGGAETVLRFEAAWSVWFGEAAAGRRPALREFGGELAHSKTPSLLG